jgi:hypothetical protein
MTKRKPGAVAAKSATDPRFKTAEKTGQGTIIGGQNPRSDVRQELPRRADLAPRQVRAVHQHARQGRADRGGV